MRKTAEDRLPGDPDRRTLVDQMIRVDQAGEFGAVRIYTGQLAVLRRGHAASAIRRMAEQEQTHLKAFNRLIVERRARPTLLSPVWHVAGFALGAATAALGAKAAMACTAAVEEVIEEHYARQAEQLGDDEGELRTAIQTFRDDEMKHRDTALEQGATEAIGYELLSAGIKAGSRLAIWLSTRL